MLHSTPDEALGISRHARSRFMVIEIA